MGKKTIILIGGGGHCKSCIDVIHATGQYTITGILDVAENVGKEVLGITITGTDDDIEKLVPETDYFLISVGHVKSAAVRKRVFERVTACGGKFPVIISPRAYISPDAEPGAGTIIMHDAILNAGAVTGLNCIINSKALLEHDTTIGDHCHIATAAVINGDVSIGNESFIGSNATIKQGITIGSNVVIGAGVIVLAPVKDDIMIKSFLPHIK